MKNLLISIMSLVVIVIMFTDDTTIEFPDHYIVEYKSGKGGFLSGGGGSARYKVYIDIGYWKAYKLVAQFPAVNVKAVLYNQTSTQQEEQL